MPATFNFSSGELDTGTGLVLSPGLTATADVTEAGWRPLDAQNDWNSFAISKLVIWRHSFAVSARFHPGRLVLIDCHLERWKHSQTGLVRDRG